MAIHLKTTQLFSYERLRKAFFDLFGLEISEGGLMNMFKRVKVKFAAVRATAIATLREAGVVACDETGVRIEGVNAYHWVFCAPEAVVHGAEFTRSAQAIENAMAGHRPDVWISDRYSAQQGHADQQQTCLAHLYRAARFVDENGEDDDLIAYRLKAWFARAFALNKGILDIAASTLKAKKRALKRDLKAILTTPTSSTLAHDLVAKIGRARNQLLTFCDHPGQVEPTNNQSERALRPSVIQRKVTNGYRAQWAADHEAAVRTALDTARLAGAGSFQTILNIVQA